MPAITPGDKPLSTEDLAPRLDESAASELDESVPKPGPDDEKGSSVSVDCDATLLSAGAEIPPDVGFAPTSFPFPCPVVGW